MIRSYLMIARPDQADALKTALDALATAVRGIEGCSGVELLVDAAAPERFTFLERWDSAEIYEAQSKTLPKTLFAPVMAALAEPPQSARLETLLSL